MMSEYERKLGSQGNMIKKILYSLTLLAVLARGAAGQEEQWLQYKTLALTDYSVIRNYNYLTVQPSLPAGAVKPELKSDKAIFAKWDCQLAPGKVLWMIIDKASKYGSYNRLYIDSNGDGKFDEAPLIPSSAGSNYAQFDGVKIVFRTPDGPVTYHFHLNFRDYSEERALSLLSGCCYSGRVNIGGQEKYCRLIDYNCNGTFNDKSKDFETADRILISSDASLQKNVTTSSVGTYISIDNEFYQPEIAPDGATIKFSPAKNMDFGMVRLSPDVKTFAAAGENGLFSTMPIEGLVKLPVGTYRVYEWSMQRKDAAGKLWQVEGARATANFTFTVNKDAETALEIGEPIKATLDVKRTQRTYSVNRKLVGKYGEQVLMLSSGAQPRAPKVNIKNEAGDYNKTYTLEYG